MATYTATQAADTYPVTQPPAGLVAAAPGVYEIASALSKDDIVKFCKTPSGASILGGELRGDDIDTGTEALELDIGTATDPDALLDSGVITGDAVTEVKGATAIWMPLLGTLKDGPIATTAETTWQGTVTAAANDGGTGTLYLLVLFMMPIETATA